MIDPYTPLKQVMAQTTPNTAGGTPVVGVLIAAVLSILGIAILLFLGLVALRLAGSWRERRLLDKKERLSSLVYYVVTEDRSVTDVVATVRDVVPARDRKALEMVLLENIRFLKGREQEALTSVFEKMGFADEDIEGLRKPGTTRKAESAYHLGTMRTERAVPALIATLESSPRPEVVFSCLNALSKIGTTEALEAVIQYLASSPELETLRVAEVILERKQEFSRYLKQWLERGDPDVGRLVFLLDVTGATKDVGAVPELVRFLNHDDARVRASAARSLGNIGAPAACEELVEAMADDQAEVRSEAAEALGKLQCDNAVAALKEGLADADLTVRMNCAEGLSMLGEEGREVLEEALLTMEEARIEVAAEVLETLEARTREGREG
jgi:hypothetical protein